MSGETKGSVSGWTIDTLAAMQAALRIADRDLDAMNDRRLTEVAIEREKALKIKEEADKEALRLAREIQVYKDEKANELRAQINSERGLYPTKSEVGSAIEKVEALIKPLAEYITKDQGSRIRGDHDTNRSQWVVGVIIGVILGAATLVERLALHTTN